MKRALFSCLVALVVLLGLSQRAQAATIMQFQQVDPFGQPWEITAVAGVTTIEGTDVLVQVNINPAFCAEPTCGGLPLVGGVYSLDFFAQSTGDAVLVNGDQDINQPFGGTMSFTGTGAFAGVDLISFSFSDQLSGAVGASVVTLSAGDPPDLFFDATSDIFAAASLGAPRGFSIGFSDWAGGLAITGTGSSATVAASFADAAGTLNATPTPVPEPGSMLLIGTGMLGLAHRVRARMRKGKA